jgi:hypothetical protein
MPAVSEAIAVVDLAGPEQSAKGMDAALAEAGERGISRAAQIKMQDSPCSNLARPSSHLVALHPAFRLVQSYPLL